VWFIITFIAVLVPVLVLYNIILLGRWLECVSEHRHGVATNEANERLLRRVWACLVSYNRSILIDRARQDVDVDKQVDSKGGVLVHV
jgi:hypothetical protein